MLASNGLAAAWGGVAWARRDPSTVFWYLLRAAQAVVVAEAIVGTVLLAQGRHAGDPLHYVYGIAPLVISLVSEGARLTAAQAELAAARIRTPWTAASRCCWPGASCCARSA